MSADNRGNDIAAVGIPVTGFLGFAPAGTPFVAPAAGGAADLALPAAYKKAGLLTTDGGFEWTLEPDGDAIEFWQEGYSIPSGLANATLVATLAQYDETARLLAYGKTPDENGYITLDAGGHALRFVVFTEEMFKNGTIVRRTADVGVTSAKVAKSERGNVRGLEITFAAARSVALNNEHIGEWLVPRDPDATGAFAVTDVE